MDTNTFAKRQVHLDFHTSPDIENVGGEFNKADFQNALKTGNVNSITVFAKCHHSNFYYPTKFGKIHPHLNYDLTGAMVDAAHEIGVRAPIYITAGWSHNDAIAHPEWRHRNIQGKDVTFYIDNDALLSDAKPFCAWHSMCLNDGNGYTKHIYDVTEEICKRYKNVDGLFYDICAVGTECYCESCRKGMKAEGFDANNPDDARRYFNMKHTAFMKKCGDILKKYHPLATVFFNSGGADPYRNLFHPYQTHFEMEDLPTAWGGYDKMPLRAKFFSKTGKHYLGMTGKFHRDWGEFGGFKTKEALKFEVCSMALYGAGCSIGDHMHPTGKMEMQTYENIGYAYKYLEKIEPFCYNGVSTANLGMYFSDNKTSNSGLSKILLENQIDFDIVSNDNFDTFDTVIIPDSVCLSDESLNKLKQYISCGGKVLFYGKSLIKNNTFQLDCGIEYIGESEFDCDYIECGKEIENDIMKAPFLCYSTAAKIKNIDAQVFAEVIDPYFSRTYAHFCGHKNTPNNPNCQKHAGAVKKGNVMYIAHDIPSMYDEHGCVFHKRYFIKLLDLLYKNKTFEIALPSEGRCTMIKQEDKKRYCLNMVYASPIQRGSTCVIEDIVPIYNIPVKIKISEEIKEIYSGTDGEMLPFEKHNGYYSFIVPMLDCHRSIVISY